MLDTNWIDINWINEGNKFQKNKLNKYYYKNLKIIS